MDMSRVVLCLFILCCMVYGIRKICGNGKFMIIYMIFSVYMWQIMLCYKMLKVRWRWMVRLYVVKQLGVGVLEGGGEFFLVLGVMLVVIGFTMVSQIQQWRKISSKIRKVFFQFRFFRRQSESSGQSMMFRETFIEVSALVSVRRRVKQKFSTVMFVWKLKYMFRFVVGEGRLV